MEAFEESKGQSKASIMPRDASDASQLNQQKDDSFDDYVPVQPNTAQTWCLEGHCLLNGHGCGQHLDDARYWYEKSVEKGEPKAMLALGQMNDAGMGMPVNMKQAQEYYQRAADKDEPISQLKLAQLIISGKHLQMNSQINESMEADIPNSASSNRISGTKTLQLNVKSTMGGHNAQSQPEIQNLDQSRKMFEMALEYIRQSAE